MQWFNDPPKISIFEVTTAEVVNQIPLTSVQSMAYALGFVACGASRALALDEHRVFLSSWLTQGMHGEMSYMERNLEKRIDPRQLVTGAKSVISVLLNYYPGNPRVSVEAPKISRYAVSIDYHTVIKQMLWQLLDLLCKEYGPISGRAFVDSAPVLERAWAQKAGLGWVGKNGLLINPQIGSFVFIGELIVDADIEPSLAEVPNRCGTCKRCMDACPTGAIVSPGVVDARKCISYLTIEKKSPLDEQEKLSLKGWCFGCDICQEVCPWNAKAKAVSLPEIMPKQEIINLPKKALTALTQPQFDSIFGNTSITRKGFNGFRQCCEESNDL
ncbi:MAG: tRNA epoxyqueuosine(34) reductase QueG [Tenuifilaceae bacterium]|jgi:epoxyqueuosine reductase|nr:tRNA epoxyqueuosine(34) reductase QueG [Tenuifilaceae bacterium]